MLHDIFQFAAYRWKTCRKPSIQLSWGNMFIWPFCSSLSLCLKHHPDLQVSLRKCTVAQQVRVLRSGLPPFSVQHFLRSVLHLSLMSANDKKKFIMKIQAWAKEKFGGSGDPEVEDAVDCIDFFDMMFGEQLPVFAKLLQDVVLRIEALDRSCVRDPGITLVPEIPTEGETRKLKLAPWMFGFRAKDSVKGKSKMTQVYGCLVEFLERPYASAKDPIDVLMPGWISVGSEMPVFSVRHSMGFAKSLTIRVILFAVVDMRWSDNECMLVLKELQALMCIECTYSPAADPKGQMNKALGDKMTAAARTRPDVIQIYSTLHSRALMDGVELQPNIDRYLSEFQEDTLSETRKFSPLEISAVKFMPGLSEAGQKKLAYHYQAFDVEFSAWPLGKLAADALRDGTKVARASSSSEAIAPDALQLWTNVCLVSSQKREATITRRIGIFLFKIKEAVRTKKSKTLNLKFQAHDLRCKLSDELAFEVSALFTHWAPTWKSMMSAENWSKCVLKFKRGGLDAQLVEKCASKIMHTAADFRFLQAYGGVALTIVPQDSLDAQQEAAKLVREKASLAEIALLVQREENKWMKHKQDVTAWKCSSQAQRSAFKEEEKKKNLQILVAEMNNRFPARVLESPDHIHTYVNSSIDAWLLPTTSSREDAWMVWFINLSIPGYVFMHSALQAIVKAADSISNCPERTCAFIISPNTGSFGDSYSEANMRKASRDIEELLQDPDLGIMYHPISMTFDESSMPTQSTRPGQHSAFMFISSETTGEKGKEKPKSLFALSKMWIRMTVGQLPCHKLKDAVNPLAELARGDFDPTRDLSKSQRRKQWFAGWKLMECLRAKLWQGVPVTNQSYAAWVDMYGYDFSLGHCILRSVFSSAKDRAKQPSEMVCTLFWANMDTTMDNHWALLQDFHDRSGKRHLRQLLREKLYFLDGWAEEEFLSATASPSYKPTEFTATFPAASGDLPFRHEWLMLTQAKFEAPEVVAEFQKIIDSHDQKFNPSKTPYTGETLKRKAEAEATKPIGEEIPAEEGAPDNRSAFLAAHKNTMVLELFGQEFLFTATGELWCHGKVDDVVDITEPIALIYGSFKLADLADQELTKSKCFKIEFKSSEDLVQCSSEHMADKCPRGLVPLREVLAALDNPKLECHEVDPKFTKDDKGEITSQEYDIKCIKSCAFTPGKIAKEFNEEWENVGSRMFLGPALNNWDMSTKEHKGGRLVARNRLKHQDSNQIQGINPVKPGIFAKSPVKVVANTIRRWG